MGLPPPKAYSPSEEVFRKCGKCCKCFIFYELLPADWWVGQEKLSDDVIDLEAKMLRQNATGETKALLRTLTTAGNMRFKGEVARGLLGELVAQEPLVPLLEQAMQRAKEPHMASPIDTGTLLIILALLPTAIHIEKNMAASGIDL